MKSDKSDVKLQFYKHDYGKTGYTQVVMYQYVLYSGCVLELSDCNLYTV